MVVIHAENAFRFSYLLPSFDSMIAIRFVISFLCYGSLYPKQGSDQLRMGCTRWSYNPGVVSGLTVLSNAVRH